MSLYNDLLTIFGAYATKINSLKSNLDALSELNSYNYAKGTTGTNNGVTYTHNPDDTWLVNGTATEASSKVLISGTDGWVDDMKAGETYQVKFSSTDPNVALRIYKYINGEPVSVLATLTSSSEFTTPSDASGIGVRLFVASGTTVTNAICSVKFLNAPSNKDLAETIANLTIPTVDLTLSQSGEAADAKVTGDAINAVEESLANLYVDHLDGIQGVNRTYKGVTFVWDSKNKTVHAEGQASELSFANLYVDNAHFVGDILAGDVFQFLMDASQTIGIRIGFYNGETTLSAETYHGNAIIKVPDDATGMYIRAEVASGVTLDETVHYEIINSTKTFLNLRDVTYTLKNVTLSERMTVRGCGNSTILKVTDSAANALILLRECTVEDLKIIGPNGEGWVPDGVIVENHGISVSVLGSSDAERNRIKISNVEICGFAGGAIHLVNTGLNYDNSACISNCYLHNNNVGLYIPRKAEFNKISNTACSRNHYGCINNGGNNLFSNCGFNGNVTGLLMDSTGIINSNNAHGAFVGCNFAHTHAFDDRTSLYAIDLIGQEYSQHFSACIVGYGHLRIRNSSGIVFSGCSILGDVSVTVNDGGLTMFNGCVFKSEEDSPLTKTGSAVVKYHNCYTLSGSVFDPTA